MNNTKEWPDELQRIWQDDNAPIQQEKIPAIMNLVQEKGRLYFQHVDHGHIFQYTRDLLFVVGGVFLAWRSPLMLTRVSWILMAAFSLYFLMRRVWRGKSMTVTAAHGQDGRAYCTELVGLYEEQIRGVRRERRYEFMPIILMAVGAWPLMGAWEPLLVATGVALYWRFSGRMNLVLIDDLRRRQDEARRLLKEMDSLGPQV